MGLTSPYMWHLLLIDQECFPTLPESHRDGWEKYCVWVARNAPPLPTASILQVVWFVSMYVNMFGLAFAWNSEMQKDWEQIKKDQLACRMPLACFNMDEMVQKFLTLLLILFLVICFSKIAQIISRFLIHFLYGPHQWRVKWIGFTAISGNKVTDD